LGLAAVYGFVKQSGGNTRIYSELGVGTVVSVYLPLAESQCVVPTPASIPPNGVRSVVGRSVLVVDDEVDLLEIAVACSRTWDAGFSTPRMVPWRSQSSAREPRIDLLVTDIFMPGGMNGVELANRVRQLTRASRSCIRRDSLPTRWPRRVERRSMVPDAQTVS